MYKKLNLNKKLALILFVLGFIAIFAGSPYKGSNVTLNTKELSMIVQGEADHVSVDELAKWVIEGKQDYRLIDIRSEKDYNEYNIPTSENVQMNDIEKYGLTRNEKIVIYSAGGIHSAQAWMLLKARDYKAVYMLTGGIDEWKDKILFPVLPENADAQTKIDFEKRASMSKFFGGTPVSGSTSEVNIDVTKPEMPKMKSPGTTKPQQTGKKKKEGC